MPLLLDLGVAINTQNGDGFTPLHVAAMWGREVSVRLLLERGADPAISDDEEMTPLDYSESEGESSIVVHSSHMKPSELLIQLCSKFVTNRLLICTLTQ